MSYTFPEDMSAGDEIAAADFNKLRNGAGFKILTAGETIAGATLPVAVYQDTSDNEIYACDGDDNDKAHFIGFAITDGTDGNDITVQFEGIVNGFTGLTEGVKYYVQDDKTIGTTPGTLNILVGVAISETELLILKNPGIYVDEGGVTTGGLSTTDLDDSTTYKFNTGFKPRYFEATITLDINSTNWSYSGGNAWMGVRTCVIKGIINGPLTYFGTSYAASQIPTNVATRNPYFDISDGGTGGTVAHVRPSYGSGLSASIALEMPMGNYTSRILRLASVTANENSITFNFTSTQGGNSSDCRYGVRHLTVWE